MNESDEEKSKTSLQYYILWEICGGIFFWSNFGFLICPKKTRKYEKDILKLKKYLSLLLRGKL